MIKTYCDNCEALLIGRGTNSADASTRLHPSNMPIEIKVRLYKGGSDVETPEICTKCFLTALHGAFKQPESKPTT